MGSPDPPRTLGVIEQALFDTAPPVSIGRFAVRRQLGRGGMGVVYLAHDPTLRRDVAVKVHGSADGPAASERLQREAESLAQLRHRNVVSVFEVGRTDDDEVFVVMEYLEGPTLRGWVLREQPELRSLLRQYGRCAGGLQEAHDRGLVHRDFKPENVVIDADGEPRIIDFGLARVGEASVPITGQAEIDDSATTGGGILGTPRYMAPELWDGAAPTPRSDQFAFAVALFESIAGAPPYRERKWTPPSRPARLDRPTWRILRRALEPAPADRWPSMRALSDALVRAADRPARGRMLVGIAAAVGLGAAGTMVVVTNLNSGAGDVSTEPCAPGTDLLRPAQRWDVRDPGVRRDEAGLHLAYPEGGPSFARATLLSEPMSFRDRAVVFEVSRLPQADTTNELFLTLRNAEDEALSILIWGGAWAFPMAPNTHGLALPIDRTVDRYFRIQVEDQETLPDLVAFEFSPDGRAWTPIARVEGSLGMATVELSALSNDPVTAPDSAVVRRITCDALQPVAAMGAERDRARVER